MAGGCIGNTITAGDLRLPIEDADVAADEEYISEGARGGAIASVAVSSVSLSPDTPIKKVIKFRQSHQDELDRFRNAILMLESKLHGDYPTRRAFDQGLRDVYVNEIRPAVADLAQARRSASLAAGPDMLRAAGSPCPHPLLALVADHPLISAVSGATGLLFSVSLAYMRLRVDRDRELRNQPFSYLLSAREEFGSVE